MSSTPIDPTMYYTPTEVAGVLRVHARTLRRWLGRGEIPSAKLGRRRILVHGQAVLDFLASRERPAVPAGA